MKKIISCLIIIVILVIGFLPCCYAANGADDAIKDGDKFLDVGRQHIEDKGSPISDEGLKNLSNSMSNMLLLIGTIVAVAVGVVLGIKFMLASVEEKAKVKEMLTIYIIGCVVLFGAFTIWKICVELFSSI